MYLADSIPGVIHAFVFDGERGTISSGRALVTMSGGSRHRAVVGYTLAAQTRCQRRSQATARRRT
jgi:hypothetical protein